MRHYTLLFIFLFSSVSEGIFDKKCQDGFIVKSTELLVSSLEKGSLPGVKKAVSNQANIHGKIKLGQTALILALKANNMEAFKHLLENRANPNETDSLGRTPLLWAIKNKNAEAAELLIKTEGIDLEMIIKDQPYLHHAIRNSAEEIVNLFLNSNFDPNTLDPAGKSALHLATESGHIPSVELLATHSKIELDIKDTNGHSPLQYAMRIGQNEVAQILRKHGATSAAPIPVPPSKPIAAAPPGSKPSGKQPPLHTFPENPKDRTYNHTDEKIDWTQGKKNIESIVLGVIVQAKLHFQNIKEILGLVPPSNKD